MVAVKGKTYRYKDVSLETKVKIMVFPIAVCRCESRTVKKAGKGEKLFRLEYSAGGELC